jgi:hypothetical protein
LPKDKSESLKDVKNPPLNVKEKSKPEKPHAFAVSTATIMF